MSEGYYTLRKMYQGLQNMGPISTQDFCMFFGFSADMMPEGHEQKNQARAKLYMTIMDAMAAEELDCTDPADIMDESRIKQIAQGSGCSAKDVKDMLDNYSLTRKLMRKENQRRDQSHESSSERTTPL